MLILTSKPLLLSLTFIFPLLSLVCFFSNFINGRSLCNVLKGANKWRRIKGKDRRLDKIDEVKMKMDWAMDENQLLQKIKDSNVLHLFVYLFSYYSYILIGTNITLNR